MAQYDTLEEAIDSFKKALCLLLKAKGVRLAMASTYLRFRNPQVFQIIDQRVYRQVQIWKKSKPINLIVPIRIEDQIDLYMQYLQDLRDMCRDKGVDFFSADRVFYIEDKKDKNNTVNGYGSTQKLKVNRELRQGFGIPSENRKVKSEYITATDKTQLAHRCATVVAKRSPSPQGT